MSYNYNEYRSPYNSNPYQPESGSGQNLRNASIQSLLAVDLGAKEIRRGYEYEVDVFTQSGFQFKMKISLPDHFPSSPPVVKVDRPVWHQWVDSHSLLITGATELYPPKWNQHISLGRVIKDTRTSLFNAEAPKGNTPMQPLQSTPATTFGYANPSVHPTRSNVPAVPSEYPQLTAMSMAELQDLAQSDAKFWEFFIALPQVKDMEKIEEDLRDDNLLVSQQNLSQEPELTVLKETLAHKHAAIAEKKSLYDTYLQKQHDLAEKFTPAALEHQLEEAHTTAKNLANEIADRFNRGEEKDVQEFCHQYKEASKLAHMRKIKLGKLKQLH
eukprot:m.258753 g.258753  ORF g.258753 m.258753 type:complete len:328 (-) comp37009_c0_seq1:412-1395(-)